MIDHGCERCRQRVGQDIKEMGLLAKAEAIVECRIETLRLLSEAQKTMRKVAERGNYALKYMIAGGVDTDSDDYILFKWALTECHDHEKILEHIKNVHERTL